MPQSMMTGTRSAVIRANLGASPQVLGPYRIHERLGVGGVACVYRAQRGDDPYGTDVALKRLHPHLADDSLSIATFVREARIACLLDHPVIRRVYSLRREQGEVYMTMEYVAGSSLYSLLKRASSDAQDLPLAGILSVLHRLCDALHYAHELVDEHGTPAGFVHRDISPSNLIIARSGQLKLIDMGVSRAYAGDLATNSGLIKGKYGYMAPEVLASEPFDRRADVFSMGVVAWELLTRCRLFAMREAPIGIEQVRSRLPEPPSQRNEGCPRELDSLVLRALAVQPEERWPSCAILSGALEDVARQLNIQLSDNAIAELLLHAGQEVPVPSESHHRDPRTRLARGTDDVHGEGAAPFALNPQVPPPLAQKHLLLPQVQPPAERAVRGWRPLVIGAVVGSLVTAAGVAVVGRAASEGRSEPSIAHQVTDDGAQVADASDLHGGGQAGSADPKAPNGRRGHKPRATTAADRDKARDQVSAEKRPDKELPPAGSAADSGDFTAAAGVRTVSGSAVTRLDGPWPRSRASTALYRARMCINEQGEVTSVTVNNGPRRLFRRIARSLQRWSYEPYTRGGRPEPVCFDLESRLRKWVPRDRNR